MQTYSTLKIFQKHALFEFFSIIKLISKKKQKKQNSLANRLSYRKQDVETVRRGFSLVWDFRHILIVGTCHAISFEKFWDFHTEIMKREFFKSQIFSPKFLLLSDDFSDFFFKLFLLLPSHLSSTHKQKLWSENRFCFTSKRKYF